MKLRRPRKLTRAEKIHLSSLKLDWSNWLLVSIKCDFWEIENKKSGRIRKIPVLAK